MPEDREPTPARLRHHKSVPGLPRRLADPTPVVVIGTLLWMTGAVLLTLQGWGAAQGDIRFWTCAAGAVLGIIGFGVFRWQRSASRRGVRGAWKGLSGLDG